MIISVYYVHANAICGPWRTRERLVNVHKQTFTNFPEVSGDQKT